MANKNYLYLTIIVLILVILWLLRKKTIDGRDGGFLRGNSHLDGGIKARIIKTGEIVELQGNEAIIDENTMQITDTYRCEGKPIDIASAINELGGSGAKFGNGRCIKI